MHLLLLTWSQWDDTRRTHNVFYKQRQAQGKPLVYVSCQQYLRKGFGVTCISFIKKIFPERTVYIPLINVFIGILNFYYLSVITFQLKPLGVLSSWLLCHFDMFPYFFFFACFWVLTSLLSVNTRCSRFLLYFPFPSLKVNHFCRVLSPFDNGI